MSQECIHMLQHLTALYNRFECYHVNPAEFACLKAIVLFRSGKNGKQCFEYVFLINENRWCGTERQDSNRKSTRPSNINVKKPYTI